MDALCTIRSGHCTCIRTSIAVPVIFSVIFVLFNLIAFCAKFDPQLDPAPDRPMVQRVSAWIGIFGFMIGTSSGY